MWKPQRQNNCCSLLGFWQATFNLKPSKNGYFYVFFFSLIQKWLYWVYSFPLFWQAGNGCKNCMGQNMAILFGVQLVGPPVNGPTCQWACDKEVMNGCDFPSSGLGRRTNDLQNNFGSVGWGAVCIEVLGSHKSRMATSGPYLLCHNLTKPCSHR